MINEVILFLLATAAFLVVMFFITILVYRSVAGWSGQMEERRAEYAKRYRETEFGGDEIGTLVKSFDSMESALTREMARVARMTAEREKVQAELDVATRIQRDMIPDNFSEIDCCDIYGSMTPAKEVGGDFYDFFMLDDTRLCLVMADVSGKGVPGALFMTIAKVLIRQRALSGGKPSEILSDVNTMLCADNREMLFVTVWLGIVDTKSGTLCYCNAGHEYPVILHHGTCSLKKEAANDPPLALADGLPFEDKELQLAEGDGLFVYTDGVPEAKNEANERYGLDQMLRVLEEKEAVCAPCQETVLALSADLDAFVRQKEPFDDVTMLMIRMRPSPA